MSKITKIYARQVIDSRGNPTIETEVHTKDGNIGCAIVPSGASTGTREALELRDGDKKYFQGKSVLKAVANVNKKIAPKLIKENFEVTNQKLIDETMIKLDGTKNKSKLGANAILSVSMACADAAAKDKKLPLWKYLKTLTKDKESSLPVPMLNVINGGAHSDNNIDFQEYMIFPLGAKSFQQAIQWSTEIFHTLAKLLNRDGFSTAKGDEGGFAPDMKDNIQPLQYIMRAIRDAGYIPGKDVYIALDIAASEFYNAKTETYFLAAEKKKLSSSELIDYYEKLIEKFPIISIEDGIAEQDWEGFKLLTETLGDVIQLVGDDLFVTNKEILAEGIEKQIANAILIKVNQIGTVTETIETIELAKKNGYASITSHRSGESEDTFIADFSVALNTKQIKTGSMSRSERVAKYNQLLRISEDKNIKFFGKKSLNIKL